MAIFSSFNRFGQFFLSFRQLFLSFGQIFSVFRHFSTLSIDFSVFQTDFFVFRPKVFCAQNVLYDSMTVLLWFSSRIELKTTEAVSKVTTKPITNLSICSKHQNTHFRRKKKPYDTRLTMKNNTHIIVINLMLVVNSNRWNFSYAIYYIVFGFIGCRPHNQHAMRPNFDK